MNIVATHNVFPPRKVQQELTRKAKRTFPATLADVKLALTLAGGNLTKAAEVLGVSRRLLARKIEITPVLEKILDDIKQQNLDMVEEKLLDQAEMGNVTAITFYLRTQGKERGYTEKNTLEHELGAKTLSSAAALVEALRQRDRPSLPDPDTIEIPQESVTWQDEN
jgi:hypothetical protein